MTAAELAALVCALEAPAHAITYAELGEQRSTAARAIAELHGAALHAEDRARRAELLEAEVYVFRRLLDPSAVALVDRVAELERLLDAANDEATYIRGRIKQLAALTDELYATLDQKQRECSEGRERIAELEAALRDEACAGARHAARVDEARAELAQASERTTELEDALEAARRERTEVEADLNAARARADLAEARIAAARIEVAQIIANHQPMWVSAEAKAAGKDPWVCQMCGTADGSWPCATRMAADAALDGEAGA